MFYVLCDDDCRYESMTKEQIIAAIAEATGSTPTSVDDAFITKIKEQNAGVALKIWFGTRAEYNALTETDPETYYIINDESYSLVNHTHDEYLTEDEKGVTLATLANDKVDAKQASAAINAKTASYTLTLSDAGKLVTMESADTLTVTIPANASVAFPVGTEIEIAQLGAGAVTIVPADNVTINSMDGMNAIAGQYGIVCLKQITANVWLLGGALG